VCVHSDFIKPISLPPPNDTDHLNDASVVAGWGSTSDSNFHVFTIKLESYFSQESYSFNISYGKVNYSPSDVLLKTETEVVNSSICRRSFNSAINIVDDFFICTQGDIGTGPCSVYYINITSLSEDCLI